MFTGARPLSLIACCCTSALRRHGSPFGYKHRDLRLDKRECMECCVLFPFLPSLSFQPHFFSVIDQYSSFSTNRSEKFKILAISLETLWKNHQDSWRKFVELLRSEPRLSDAKVGIQIGKKQTYVNLVDLVKSFQTWALFLTIILYLPIVFTFKHRLRYSRERVLQSLPKGS